MRKLDVVRKLVVEIYGNSYFWFYLEVDRVPKLSCQHCRMLLYRLYAFKQKVLGLSIYGVCVCMTISNPNETSKRMKSLGWPRVHISPCHPQCLYMLSGWHTAQTVSHLDKISHPREKFCLAIQMAYVASPVIRVMYLLDLSHLDKLLHWQWFK